MSSLVAKTYGWQTNKQAHSHAYLVPACIEELKKHKISNLLDIGTGNGATLPFWLSLGLKVSAIEPDEKGWAYASQHKAADVRRLAIGDQMPLEWKNSFDGIICLEVVEHLFDPVQLVKSADYVLKSGGVAIVSTPYHGYVKNLALLVFNKWDFHHHPLKEGGHIKFWSRNSLSALFVSQGFNELSFKGVGRIPFMWKSMIMVFQKP